MSTETIQRPVRKEKDIEFFKPTLSREDLKGVLECLVDEHLSNGEIVERFEKTFCHTFKIKHAISSNSLTSAYHLALLALGVKAGIPFYFLVMHQFLHWMPFSFCKQNLCLWI